MLGRNELEMDVESIADYVTGRRVLVTGAGGSIGSELCRQLHRYAPAELMMLDRDESALHALQLSIHGRALLDSDEVVLCDIRDRAGLHSLFASRRPEVVFHAAALKHLPMLEQYPAEAVKTNVVGTLNVLDACDLVGVSRFVNISTDKAADPSSVLGWSKRISERLTAQRALTDPGIYVSVRFGNVLGSRGSVLTSFAKQIADGGPVTVTDPDVTRYFMTIEEACQLVVQAAAIGAAGEALVLDMGEPVRILDVAKQLIDQSGSPIRVVFTGLREGEKMHEDLFGSEEPRDLRPMHPLVSHVPVPALSPRQALELPVTGTPRSVREAIALLSAEPGDARRDRRRLLDHDVATQGRFGRLGREPGVGEAAQVQHAVLRSRRHVLACGVLGSAHSLDVVRAPATQREHGGGHVGPRHRLAAVADVDHAVHPVFEQVSGGACQLVGEAEPAPLVVDNRRRDAVAGQALHGAHEVAALADEPRRAQHEVVAGRAHGHVTRGLRLCVDPQR